MQCAISGEIPKEPVVSIKSGYVFEKSLIEKYISANKKCPITGEPLSEEDLIPLKGSNAPVKPRVPTATSIPGLIQLFQNEWEASTLETYTLKQQLDAAKQELAHTLYRYYAACRVIARLTKERDEARQLLSSRSASAATASSLKRKHNDGEDNKNGGVEEGEEEEKEKSSKKPAVPCVMPTALSTQVAEALTKLVSGRKGRKKPADLASEDAFASYSQTASIPLHNSSMPGVKAMDLRGTRVLTGGVDGSLILADIKTASESKTVFTGHSKPISAVALHPTKEGIFVSAGFDGVAKVWNMRNKSKPRCVLDNGMGDGALSMSLHPALDVLLTGGRSKAWSLWDIESGLEVVRASGAAIEAGSPVTASRFHPDGRIMANGGEDGVVRLWDSTTSDLVKDIEGHKSRITDIAFSNNG